MNEPQPPMPQQKPAEVRPWLLIVFLMVLLAGGGYLGYYFWNKSKIPTATTPTAETPPTTTPTATNTSEVSLKNVTFYLTSTSGLYSDQEAELNKDLVSACAIKDMAGQTIQAKYKNQSGTVKITQGNSPGCPPSVIVAVGTFTSTASAADWETFNGKVRSVIGLNREYSFKYPPNHIVKENTITKENPEFYSMLNEKNEKILSFDYNGTGIGEGDPNIQSSDETVVLGANSVETKSVRMNGQLTNRFYFIEGFNFSQKKMDPDTDEIIRQILSTFQFTK